MAGARVNEDKATRYQRLKRQTSVVSLLSGGLLLGGLVGTGWSVTLRDAAERMAGRVAPESWQPGATVFCYVLLLSLLNEIAGLSLGIYGGFFLERRYQLSNQTAGSWLAETFTVP